MKCRVQLKPNTSDERGRGGGSWRITTTSRPQGRRVQSFESLSKAEMIPPASSPIHQTIEGEA